MLCPASVIWKFSVLLPAMMKRRNLSDVPPIVNGILNPLVHSQYLSADGAYAMVAELEAAIQRGYMKENYIQVVIPPSATSGLPGVGQECDRMPCFKNLKALLKKLLNELLAQQMRAKKKNTLPAIWERQTAGWSDAGAAAEAVAAATPVAPLGPRVSLLGARGPRGLRLPPRAPRSLLGPPAPLGPSMYPRPLLWPSRQPRPP